MSSILMLADSKYTYCYIYIFDNFLLLYQKSKLVFLTFSKPVKTFWSFVRSVDIPLQKSAGLHSGCSVGNLDGLSTLNGRARSSMGVMGKCWSKMNHEKE